MRRWLKIAAWTGGGIAALAALLALASMLVTRTARFQNFVRTKIVSVTEESTGGRVEIGSFEFHWQGLEATMTNFVLHGSEPAGAAPLFRAAKIETRLKLLAGFKKFVDLEYLGIDRPEANVMVFADGSTNVPRPNNVKPGEPALQTVVDLAIHKFEVANGGFTFAERRMPLQARGENLRAVLGYRAIPASYSGNLHIGALRVAQGNGEAIEASFDAPVEIGKDRVEVKGARLATEESQIIFDASVANMASPEIAAHAMAHVALKQVERAAKIAMHPCEKNAPCFADADIDARTEGSWLRISSAKLSIGKSRLEAAGTNGNLLISSTIQMDEIARLFGEQLPAMTARFDGGASIRGLSGVSLKGSVSAPLAPEWGYGGAAGGTISASANLKARGTVGIRATAAIAIAPGKEGVPVSGRIHADYDGASNTVRFANSELGLPHSHLAFSGTLGHTLEATLESTNLRDFEPALKMMKNSPEKLPVELNGGRVALTAQIDGPIARPQIGGHLDVDRFSIENRRFDRMSADFSASAASASVRNATLARRSLSAAFAGSIGLRDWAASEASPVDAAFELRNGDIADALALAGEADIPAKGALTASARIQGTIGNPLGSIHVAAANGVAYDQPFDQADAQVELADGLIRLASLDVSQGAGRIRANGTYSHPRDSMMGGHAEIHVAGNGIELGEIAALKKQRPGLAGSIQMNASASADIREIAGKTDAVLANAAGDVTAHGLHEDRKAYGDVTAHVETSGASVKFRVDSNLAGGAIRIDGGAKLPSMEARAIAKSDPQKDFPLTAKVTVSNLPIESALALADQTLAARGILALTGSFAGTIADPAGDARIDLTRGAIYDEPIDSVQGDVRFASQSVEVSNLRAASAAGNATLNGRFTHPANRFDEGRFEGRVESAGLRIARIHFVQAQKPGIDGTIKLNFDAAGDLHGREVTLSKLDGNGSANAIAFNGHGYGDATLAASTRNGIATIRADSDFA
ncbi:MAG TPA: hypothetical protein VKS01_00330, partial [Bryobacteraceae bacterium]|nr:hypothetical protein [Bryobacteraceae bacterium]